MDLSRLSLAHSDSRRWNYSWRDSSRCGRGSGTSRHIRNLATVSVRSSLPHFITLTKYRSVCRCAIASTVQVYRSTSGRFHSGVPPLEGSCTFCPRTPSFHPVCRLLDAPPSACSTAVHPLSLACHPDTPTVFYTERAPLCDIQAWGGYFLK